MSFKYSAFIENSQEAREWLESIGYDMRLCDNYNEYTCAGIDGVAFTTDSNYPSFRLFLKEKAISCLDNFDLFKAITAMRDDCDQNQWFTNGEYWHQCYCENFGTFLYAEYDGDCGTDLIESFHKATLEELINHFKK